METLCCVGKCAILFHQKIHASLSFLCVQLLELLVPIVIIVALGGLKSLFKPKLIKANIPSVYYPSYATFSTFEQLYTNIPYCQSNLIWNCFDPSGFTCPKKCQMRHIAVAPADASNVNAASAAQNFVSWMSTQSELANQYSTFVFFPSENALLSYFDDAGYANDPKKNIYSSAIIFKNGYPNWDYTFRMNQTYYPAFWYGGNEASNPQTLGNDLDLSVTYNSDGNNDGPPYVEAYIETNQFTLSDIVNSFIATTTCIKTGACRSNSVFAINTIGAVEFPSPEFMVRIAYFKIFFF